MKKLIISCFTIGTLIGGFECSAQTVSGQVTSYNYVDLGLPSGTKWATCNVGASKPTEYGNYFAWGETKPKEDYSWNSYKWCNVGNEGWYNISKYMASINKYNITDNKKVMNGEDDAATANWGSTWRTPTVDELIELIEGCEWEWTSDFNESGVAGALGTSNTNGATIFLPAAGTRANDHLSLNGSFGNYWTSSLREDLPGFAYFLTFSDSNIDCLFNERYHGRNVRAVTK